MSDDKTQNEEILSGSPIGQAGEQDAKKDVEDNKVLAALGYIFILFLVPLLGKRESKYAQFHAKQGLVLFIVELIVFVFSWVPLLGQLAMLALLIIAVMGIVKALNGEWWKIPYIYGWSTKINL